MWIPRNFSTNKPCPPLPRDACETSARSPSALLKLFQRAFRAAAGRTYRTSWPGGRSPSMGISGCGPVISFVEAELAVGRWRATDCVVLLARAATHRKASGSPSFTVCALTARAVLPQDTFLGCPFTGTPFTASFSRYHVTRKSEWRRLRFPCSPTQPPTWRFATHTRLRQSGILSQWVPTPFDFIDNLFRRVFRPLRRLGRRFAVPALVTRSTSRSDFYSLATFRFEIMGARTLRI